MELFYTPGFYIASFVFVSLLSLIWIPVDLRFDDNDEPED
jgi:hypothetical protein